MGIIHRTGGFAGDHTRNIIAGVVAVLSAITMLLGWHIISIVLIFGNLFNVFMCVMNLDSYEDSKGRFKRVRKLMPSICFTMLLTSIWGIFKYQQLANFEAQSGFESIVYALAGGRGKFPFYGFIITAILSAVLGIYTIVTTNKSLQYIRSGQRKINKKLDKYATKNEIRRAKYASGGGVANAVGRAAGTVASSVTAVQTANNQIAQNKLANAQTKLALADTQIDIQRAQNTQKVVKAAGTGMTVGATAGALTTGVSSGVSVGAAAGANEAEIMHQRITGQPASYSGHIPQGEANARAIGAAALNIMREKAAKMGIIVDGRSDEEVAADVVAFASPTQLAEMPEGMSDVEKATTILCG